MNDNLPPKKDVALALLERSSVFVHLDPRARGVVVPQGFKRQPQLVLQIGLNMAVQIPDLRLDDDGMSCTLSFNRSPFFCVLPWASVFAMVGEDGRGMVWPDDVPVEIQQSVGQPERRAAPPPKTADAERKPLAVAPTPGSTNGKGAARRSKRKDERPRPQLVAVPRDGDGESAAPAPARARKPAQKGAGPRDITSKGAARKNDKTAADDSAIEPQPEARPRPAPRVQVGKPRRELPPYLRVVK